MSKLKPRLKIDPVSLGQGRTPLRKPNADEHECGLSARSLSRLQAGRTANIFQE
jgi:hypothetical protein